MSQQIRAHLQGAASQLALSRDSLADAVIVVLSRQQAVVEHHELAGGMMLEEALPEDPAYVEEVGRFRPSDDVLSLQLGRFAFKLSFFLSIVLPCPALSVSCFCTIYLDSLSSIT